MWLAVVSLRRQARGRWWAARICCASFEGRGCSGLCSAKEVGFRSFLIRETEVRYYREISLWHGLLTCSFMFLELMVYFLVLAMCCYQSQTGFVAVVTSPRKGAVLW